MSGKTKNIIAAACSIVAVCVIIFCVRDVFPVTAVPENSFVWSLPGETLTLTIASTSAEQELGLGDRPSLSSNSGMLFVFDKPNNYGFWMKDMEFPIDIIWLDQDFKIVHIENSLSPSTYPSVFYPGSPSKYVIEVNSGLAQQHSLYVGETLQLDRLDL